MSQAPVKPKPSTQHGVERRSDAWWAAAVCGLLLAAVALVFGQSLHHEFLNFDDGYFVYDEPHVSGGLSWSGIAWAFTAGPLGEWYPLSMLSHMLDCQLYGLDPAGHHLTNVLLHGLASVTLFVVLWRMTAGLWPSALVAALFAIHPLHVESVAWLAERRDVLSGLFFMLTVGAYGEHVRRPQSIWRYLAVAGFLTLGLMAKPILVTVPAILLLLDYWPLQRFGQIEPSAAACPSRPASFPWRVVWDKLPLLALALGAVGVTMLTHNAPQSNPRTVPERLANAAISCVVYLAQLFVPVGLSPYYAHPEAGWSAVQVAAAVALLVTITAAAVIYRHRYPYFLVGWFWYIGLLAPVLSLTYVGAHARADRYTYLSQIGLYIVLVWGAMRLGAAWPARRWVFGIGSGVMLIALMACAWRQTGYWHDSQTVWERVLACDPKNVTAHRGLAATLKDQDESAAVAHYRLALEQGPNDRHIYDMVRAQAHNSLGNIAIRRGAAAAIAHFQSALELRADLVTVHMKLANLLAQSGDFDAALVHYRRSIELEPNSAPILCHVAIALADHGQTDEAIADFRQALDIDPKLLMVHTSLASLLAERGEVDEAIEHYRSALEIDPNCAPAKQGLDQLLQH